MPHVFGLCWVISRKGISPKRTLLWCSCLFVLCCFGCVKKKDYLMKVAFVCGRWKKGIILIAPSDVDSFTHVDFALWNAQTLVTIRHFEEKKLCTFVFVFECCYYHTGVTNIFEEQQLHQLLKGFLDLQNPLNASWLSQTPAFVNIAMLRCLVSGQQPYLRQLKKKSWTVFRVHVDLVRTLDNHNT